jgi:hypothetical protein
MLNFAEEFDFFTATLQALIVFILVSSGENPPLLIHTISALNDWRGGASQQRIDTSS